MAQRNRANTAQLDANALADRLGLWATGAGSLYDRLAEALAGLVRRGELRDGDLLPPERTMATALSVSRGTVVAAYDVLREAGAVQRRQGSGTRVTSIASGVDVVLPEAVGGRIFDAVPSSIDLLKACPVAAPRVIEILERFDQRVHAGTLDSVEPAGLPELRAAIAERYTSSGLPTTADQVLVTSGAQQSISLTTALLVRPGDVVLSEQTSWPGMSDNVRRLGGRLHGVVMDEHGIDVEALVAAVERLRPSLIALNPHHHNPTGTRLTPQRRREVAAVAADFGVPLVEDRVTAPLAFDGVVPLPLAAERPDATSFVVDSLSKTAWAGLRIGWVRADVDAIQQLRMSKALADLWSSIPSQVLALQLLNDIDVITRERVAELRRRAAVLAEEVARLLPEWELHPIRGGVVGWARVPASSTAFTRFAGRYGVAVAGGREFSTSSVVDDHVRLPFSLPETTIREAIGRLAQAWQEFPGVAVDPPVDVRAIV
jgi:DNA-binding transcriptional MocR family regulator